MSQGKLSSESEMLLFIKRSNLKRKSRPYLKRIGTTYTQGHIIYVVEFVKDINDAPRFFPSPMDLEGELFRLRIQTNIWFRSEMRMVGPDGKVYENVGYDNTKEESSKKKI